MEIFNTVFGNIEGIDSAILDAQARVIGQSMLENDNVRDALLNNDEETQAQVVRDNNKKEILATTRKSMELQNFYLHHPEKQSELDNAMLMLLQEQINPAYNETLLIEKITEAMEEDFKVVCSMNHTTLEEVVKALFQILNAEAFAAVDGVKRLRRILNLCYRTEGRDEDYLCCNACRYLEYRVYGNKDAA